MIESYSVGEKKLFITTCEGDKAGKIIEEVIEQSGGGS